MDSPMMRPFFQLTGSSRNGKLSCWGAGVKWVQSGGKRTGKNLHSLKIGLKDPKGPKMKGSSPNHPFSGASWQFWGG